MPPDDTPPPPYSETDIYSLPRTSTSITTTITMATSSPDDNVILTPPPSPPPPATGHAHYLIDVGPDTATAAASAATYFTMRPPPPPPSGSDAETLEKAQLQRQVITYDLPTAITTRSTPSDFPFPATLVVQRDVRSDDWRTFINYLLPHHIEQSSKDVISHKLQFMSLSADGEPSSAPVAAGQGDKDQQDSSTSEICLVDTEAGEAPADPLLPRHSQLVVAAALRQWNDGFFGPRGILVRFRDGQSAAQPDQLPRIPGAWGSSFNTNRGPTTGTNADGAPVQDHGTMRTAGNVTGGRPATFNFAGITVDGDRFAIGNNHFVADRNGVRIGGITFDDRGISYGNRTLLPSSTPASATTRGCPTSGSHVVVDAKFGTVANANVANTDSASAHSVATSATAAADAEAVSWSRDRQWRRSGSFSSATSASSLSSESSSSSLSSSGSAASVGSLPPLYTLEDRQLPMAQSYLNEWLSHPEQPATHDTVIEAKRNILQPQSSSDLPPAYSASQATAASVASGGMGSRGSISSGAAPSPAEMTAMREEVKVMMQKWRELKRRQKQAARQQHRASRQRRRQLKREARQLKRDARQQRRLKHRQEKSQRRHKRKQEKMQREQKQRDEQQQREQADRDARSIGSNDRGFGLPFGPYIVGTPDYQQHGGHHYRTHGCSGPYHGRYDRHDRHGHGQHHDPPSSPFFNWKPPGVSAPPGVSVPPGVYAPPGVSAPPGIPAPPRPAESFSQIFANRLGGRAAGLGAVAPILDSVFNRSGLSRGRGFEGFTRGGWLGRGSMYGQSGGVESSLWGSSGRCINLDANSHIVNESQPSESPPSRESPNASSSAEKYREVEAAEQALAEKLADLAEMQELLEHLLRSRQRQPHVDGSGPLGDSMLEESKRAKAQRRRVEHLANEVHALEQLAERLRIDADALYAQELEAASR